jgi:hypothetical protein
VCGGREADHKKFRLRIAKAGDRFAPILLITIGAALHFRDASAVFTQPRAAFAGDYFASQNLKFGQDTRIKKKRPASSERAGLKARFRAKLNVRGNWSPSIRWLTA